MTFTYAKNPGTETPAQRKDSVRLLVGDTDYDDKQLEDEEIFFSLSTASNDIFAAGAICARLIAAKYARLVDTTVDETGIRARYDQRQKSYSDLAVRLDNQSKQYGVGGTLGVPAAGGISVSDVKSADTDSDRVKSVFTVSRLVEFDRDETSHGT